MGNNNAVDEDILNDVKNLFIEDGPVENETSDNTNVSEPEVKPKLSAQPRISLLKAPLNKPKQETEPSKTTIKDKITEKVPEPKPTAPAEKPTIIKKEKEESKDKKETTKQPPLKDEKPTIDKCKSNSDCDSNSFCIVKTGKCTAKLTLNLSGCSANDQCADSSAVCYTKTCMLSCKVGDDSVCKVDGQGCVEVKDLKLFQGLKGGLNGVCDKVKSSKPVVAVKNSPSSSGTSKSSIALISASAVILLTGLIVGFIYLRGYLRRRNRNTNPDMFLFNKLQRHASVSLMSQPTDSVERLNARLSNVGGARFTRWAVLSNDSAGASGI